MRLVQFTQQEQVAMKKSGNHTRTHAELINMIEADLREVDTLRDEVRALTRRAEVAEAELARFKFSHYGTGAKQFFLKV